MPKLDEISDEFDARLSGQKAWGEGVCVFYFLAILVALRNVSGIEGFIGESAQAQQWTCSTGGDPWVA